MANNLITEIFDKQAVLDNLNQLGELINSSLKGIVDNIPKIEKPSEAIENINLIKEAEKQLTDVQKAKKQVLNELEVLQKKYADLQKNITQATNNSAKATASFTATIKQNSVENEKSYNLFKRQADSVNALKAAILDAQKNLQENFNYTIDELQKMKNLHTKAIHDGVEKEFLEQNEQYELFLLNMKELKDLQTDLTRAENERVTSIKQGKAEIKRYQQALYNLNLTTEEGRVQQSRYQERISELSAFVKDNTDSIDKQSRNVGNYKSALEGLNLEMAGGLRIGIRKLKDELYELEMLMKSGVTLTDEQTKKYEDLKTKLGELTNTQKIVSAQAKVLGDNFRDVKFATESIGLGVNVFTSLQSATALLGGEMQELQKIMAKIVAVQQILHTVTKITNATNKNGVIVLNLKRYAQAAATRADVAAAAGAKGAAVANNILAASLKGLAASFGAVMAVAGVFVLAVAGISSAISKQKRVMAEAKEVEKERQRELKELNSETYKQKEALEKVVEQLNEYKGTLSEIAGSFTIAIEKVDVFAQKSGKMLVVNKIMTEYNEKLSEYISAVMAYAKIQDRAGGDWLEQQNEMKDKIEELKKELQEVSWYMEATDETNRRNMGRTAQREWATIDRLLEEIKEVETSVDEAYKNIVKQNEGTIVKVTNTVEKSTETTTKVVDELAEALKRLQTEFSILSSKNLTTFNNKVRDLNAQFLNGKLSVEEFEKAISDLQTEFNLESLKSELEFLESLNELLTGEEAVKNQEKISKLKVQIQKVEVEELVKLRKKEAEELVKLRKKEAEEFANFLKDIEDSLDEAGKVNLENQLSREERINKSTELIKQSIVQLKDQIMGDLANLMDISTQKELDRLQRLDEAYSKNYDSRKNYIEKTILDEQEKANALEKLDKEKLDFEEKRNEKEAQIKKRQAKFDIAMQSVQSLSTVVAATAEMIQVVTKGDGYTLAARIASAIAAGSSALGAIISMIAKIGTLPAYEGGGGAKANSPFIAGEKGAEIGLGKLATYLFPKNAIYSVPEPVQILTHEKSKQYLQTNNNNYNKEVTIANNLKVEVIDNKRIRNYFKI